jgi:hypothetical protein
MEKTLGKDIEQGLARRQFLSDNCDIVEEKGYMKPFSAEKMQSNKEDLANVSIKISEIESDMKTTMAEYKGQLKPLKEKCQQLVRDIRSKAEYVIGDCYRMTDQEARMTGYYNGDGDLIEERPALAEEMQTNIFHPGRQVKDSNSKVVNS